MTMERKKFLIANIPLSLPHSRLDIDDISDTIPLANVSAPILKTVRHLFCPVSCVSLRLSLFLGSLSLPTPTLIAPTPTPFLSR
jgi:hypothetical protein